MKSLSKIFFILSCIFISVSEVSQAQYCVTDLFTTGCVNGDYIDSVSFSTINQAGTGCGTDGYSDYTNLVADFHQGTIYYLTFTVGGYTENLSLWVDYNDDSVFENFNDENPIFGFECPSPDSVYSVKFKAPTSSPLGTHRMRMRLQPGYWYFEPCQQDSLGEVHDYTANILPPEDMFYVSGTATQNDTALISRGTDNNVILGFQLFANGSQNPLDVTSFTLNHNGSTNFNADVSQVHIYWTGTVPHFSNGTPIGSANNLSNPITVSQQLMEGLNYFWVTYDVSPDAIADDYIDAECTSITVGGNSYIPDITAPFGHRKIDHYCIPVSLYSCYFSFIDGIALNTLSNTYTYCSGFPNGYKNYTPAGDLTTALQQGNSYLLTLSGPSFEYEGFGVWFDFNDDEDFADSNEYVYTSNGISEGTITGYLTIPPTTSPGEHRMRVRCKDYDTLSATQWCDTINYGETEDYTVTIVPSECFASFSLYPDSFVLHHYWAINQSSGISPMHLFWSWGDGSYDTTAYPSHTYDSAGYYPICLTIHDSTGCESTFCINYDVQKLSQENTIITIDVVDSIPDIATGFANTNVLQSSSVYPNPASENVHVKYSLSSSATVKIELYDVLGNKLQEVSNELDAGEHHTVIDTRVFSNGVYYLKIRAGAQIVSRKVVVMD